MNLPLSASDPVHNPQLGLEAGASEVHLPPCSAASAWQRPQEARALTTRARTWVGWQPGIILDLAGTSGSVPVRVDVCAR
jgi:hypothetical protein